MTALRPAALVLAALLLAACGSDDPAPAPVASATEEPSPTETEEPEDEETEEPTEEPTEETSAPPAGDGPEPTPSGTTLGIADKGLILVREEMDADATIGVTITSIVKGDVADLAPLDLGDDIAGLEPFYINLDVSNESGTTVPTGITFLGVSGLLDGGAPAQQLSVFGTFEPCDANTSGARDEWLVQGAVYSSCSIVLAPTGTTVVGAEYRGSSETGEDRGINYFSDPIRWLP